MTRAPSARTALGGQGLAEGEEHRGQAEEAERRESPEDGPPAEEDQDLPARQRGQDGRDPHHEHEEGEDPRGLPLVEAVAHDGARDDDAGAPAD